MSKRVWLHEDSGLEGFTGCLQMIITVLVVLFVIALFLCLFGALFGATWQWFTCVTEGDC